MTAHLPLLIISWPSVMMWPFIAYIFRQQLEKSDGVGVTAQEEASEAANKSKEILGI